MSPATDRPSSPLGYILADPLRKLAAIGLAVMLWLFLDAQLTKTLRIEATLEKRDVSRPLETSSTPVVWIRYSATDFTLRSTEAADPTEVRENAPDKKLAVSLELEGSAQELRRAELSQTFVVNLKPPTRADSDTVTLEFTKDDLEPANGDERIRAMLRSMTPARIAVRLEFNETSAPIELTPDKVRYPEQPTTGRIAWDRMKFSALSTRIRGPRSVVARARDRKFTVTLQPDPKATELRGRLSPGPEFATEIEMVDPVRVTVPVLPDFVDVEIPVPVLLDTGLTTLTVTDFEPVPPLLVEIAIAGALRRELSGKTATELAQWARSNVRCCAVLPSDTTLQGPALADTTFFFLNDRGLRRGFDYQLVRFPAVTVQPKSR